jgi:hypothetical protein
MYHQECSTTIYLQQSRGFVNTRFAKPVAKVVLELADVPEVAVIAVVAGQRRDIVGLDSDAREGQGVDVIARRRLVGKAAACACRPRHDDRSWGSLDCCSQIDNQAGSLQRLLQTKSLCTISLTRFML